MCQCRRIAVIAMRTGSICTADQHPINQKSLPVWAGVDMSTSFGLPARVEVPAIMPFFRLCFMNLIQLSTVRLYPVSTQSKIWTVQCMCYVLPDSDSIRVTQLASCYRPQRVGRLHTGRNRNDDRMLPEMIFDKDCIDYKELQDLPVLFVCF